MKKDAHLRTVRRTGTAARLDGIGFAASALCAIHCAAMPFAVAFLPLIGWGFLADPWLEVVITVFSITIGIASLVPSYRKYHRNITPLTILLIGFVLIFGAHFLGFHEQEPILVPLGGLSIAGSHYFNWKLSRPFHHDSCQATKTRE